jgi:hypothetical protein
MEKKSLFKKKKNTETPLLYNENTNEQRDQKNRCYKRTMRYCPV